MTHQPESTSLRAGFRQTRPKAVGGALRLAACAAMLSACVQAATYHVDASTGNDSNPGSSASPFKTIQKAADSMSSGDTCLVRSGVYRETVTIRANNTTYKVADGHTAIISGADPITGWSKHSGNIYKATMAWDLGRGKNQIFVDGKAMLEARWPNTPSLDLSKPVKSETDSGSEWTSSTAGTIIDSSLPSKNWVGATAVVAPGSEWVAYTATVQSQSSGRLNLKTDTTLLRWWKPSEALKAGNHYFLVGVYDALDSAGEWFLNTTTNTLYLWAPGGGDPSSQLIEAKRRRFALDISNRSNITLDGFKILAAAINSSGSTQNCVIQNITATYVDHFTVIDDDAWENGYFVTRTGIILDGNNNTIKDSEIAYSAGNCVSVKGFNHTLQNNRIHDASYAGTDCAVVWTEMDTSGHVISNNRLYNSGRSIIVHRRGKRLKILNNNIYNGGIQFNDLGLTYTYQSDGDGTEIAYNFVHDNLSTGHSAMGIYLDNGSSNYLVHHNVIWNTANAIQLNLNSLNNKIYNNVAMAKNFSIGGGVAPSDPSMAGTVIRNNICNASLTHWLGVAGATVDHNILSGTDPKFVDAANFDFRLKPTSSAIDAGVDVGLTQDFVGTPIPQGGKPDIGAYEYTSTPGTGTTPGVTPGTGTSPAAPAVPTGLRVLE